MKLLVKIKNLLNKIKNAAIIKLLYLAHFVLRRKLEIRFIYNPVPFVFAGNTFTINWQTQGCYKITINRLISLPGNISIVELDANLITKPLTILFYGYQRIVEKQLDVEIMHVSLKDQLGLQIQPGGFNVAIKQALLKTRFKKLRRFNFLMPAALRISFSPGFSFTSAIKSFPSLNTRLEEYNPEKNKI